MSLSYHPQNGLLLLLQAAKKLDEEELRNQHNERWERKYSRQIYDEKYPTHSYNQNYGSQKRPVTTISRAHLRTCMETLKEHLNFDNDVPRITMLTVLKKATATIQYLKQKKQCLESCEDSEKQRWAQLLKRRQVLRKKLDEKRNRSLKSRNWKERNRNCSECSVASSDDSEMDSRLGSQPRLSTQFHIISPNTQISGTAATGLNACINDPSYVSHMSKLNKGLISPTSGINTSSIVLDAYDASSSDSGFEEITVTSSIMSPNENSVPYCAIEGTVYPEKDCRAY